MRNICGFLSTVVNGLLILLLCILVIELSQYDKVDKVITNTITLEGGYVNNPKDKGGATKFGITIGSYRQFVNKNATIADLQAISSNDAKQFYKQYYFYPNNIQKLPEGIWDMVFDMCVQHGPKNAITLLQLALNRTGQRVDIDGAMGQGTIDAANTAYEATPQFVRTALISQRITFYASILAHRPDQHIFAANWAIRTAFFLNHPVL